MSKAIDVAVVGATGLVGETMVAILEERKFPVGELHLLASARSVGKSVQFRGRRVRVSELAEFDFGRVQLGLFSAGASVSSEYAPRAAAAGCVVIDNTSHFRNEEDVPLVVPEVNPGALAGYTKRNIVANPNCSTIQMVTALKPIYDLAGIERVNVATYQSVSGAGRKGVERLATQTASLLNGRSLELGEDEHQIAFNALPHIDAFEANGYTREEMKMVWETRKIFDDPSLRINATAVRVPVFHGHSEAVNIETRRKVSVQQVVEALSSAPGVEVVNRPVSGGYPTAAKDGAHGDAVFVGRIREDISHDRGLNMWVVADNLRKGAALNSVQIAELLVASGF